MFDLLRVVVLSWFEQPERKHTAPPALYLALHESTAQLARQGFSWGHTD